MKTVHTSRNLLIEYDPDSKRFIVTVRIREESIVGQADGSCPRCHSDSHVSMWEFEGPGGESNVMWLTCAGNPPCMLYGVPLRWAREVTFEHDWLDV